MTTACMKRTGEVLAKGAEEIGEEIGGLIAGCLAYVIVPLALGTIAIQMHGRQRKRQEEFPEGFPEEFSKRDKFNHRVRRLGNKLTPEKIRRNLFYGAGDFLTEEVNTRRIGAVAGATAGALAFPAHTYCQHIQAGASPTSAGISTVVLSTLLWPLFAAASGVGAAAGYVGGYGVDRHILRDSSVRD